MEEELPKYRCHKEVEALKIKSISPLPAHHEFPDSGGAMLAFERNYIPKQVSYGYVKKHSPKAGGYYVVYEGGYESWSPADVFEAGYTEI